MALLKSKKNTEKKEEVKKAPSLLKPRITEKTNRLSGSSVYVFTLSNPLLNKVAVAAEIKKEYKVTPEKIRIVAIPAKRVFVRGKWGKKQGGKKAYVYLKKGETIEFA